MINEDIVKQMISKFKDVTITYQPNGQGKFFADKCYAFDTVFFCSRFINRFRFGNRFPKLELQEKSNEYIKDLFCLGEGSSQIQNYMTETVALLCFAKVLEPSIKGEYEIIDDDLLDFISSSFENAYIFQYILAYCVFHKDKLWNLYEKFYNAPSLEAKQRVYDEYQPKYAKTDYRVKDEKKGHAFFLPKFPMIVMNYINEQNMCSRTAIVQEYLVSIGDISLNQEGTRAGNDVNIDRPKKNSYLNDFSNSYVIETLRPYLLKDYPKQKITYSDRFSIDVADVKLDMLDIEGLTQERKQKMFGSKYVYRDGTKSRTVHSEFQTGLWKNLPHVCPLCGLDFDNQTFLIASHIVPYAKCEDTYDAMNPNNGLLLCPTCDKLFESANYISIDTNGDVHYTKEIGNVANFAYLKGKRIGLHYIDGERRHYIKWHNTEWNKKHPGDTQINITSI